MKWMSGFIVLSLFSQMSHALETKKNWTQNNISPRRIQTTGANSENSGLNNYPVQIKLDDELYWTETYKTDSSITRQIVGGPSYHPGFASSGKGLYFDRVLQIAEQEDSAVNMSATDGFAWIEPTSKAAKERASKLMNWDGKEGSKIGSIDSKLVTVGACESDTFKIYVMGRYYGTADISKPPKRNCFTERQKFVELIKNEQLISIASSGTSFEPTKLTDQSALEGLNLDDAGSTPGLSRPTPVIKPAKTSNGAK